MKQKLEKWVRWIDVAANEVRDLVLFHWIYQEVQSIIDSNQEIQRPSVFYDFMFSSYAAWAVMAARRLIKNQGDSISLLGLLKEIEQAPGILTRSYFASLYKNNPEFAYMDFDRATEKKGASYVDPHMVKRHIAELELAAAPIEEFGDKVIAHHDKREPTKLPTWDELGNFIKVAERIAIRYRLLLTATGGDILLPTVIDPWKAVFEVPWIKAK